MVNQFSHIHIGNQILRFFGWSFIMIFIFSCNTTDLKQQDASPKEITIDIPMVPVSIEAGKSLDITIKSNDFITIKIDGAFGITQLFPIETKGQYQFDIPDFATRKAGLLNWSILHEESIIHKGTPIRVHAESKVYHVESYVGPQQITVEPNDFSEWMLLPRDRYDNASKGRFFTKLLKENIVERDSINTDIIYVKEIKSNQRKGKIFAETIVNNERIHEQEIILYPTHAVDFKISFSRNHNISDGKELTIISTAIIKDRFGNIVEDGTLIEFLIKKEDALFKAYGKTINGIAKTEIVHPAEPTEYVVYGQVPGFARSNSISINYVSNEKGN